MLWMLLMYLFFGPEFTILIPFTYLSTTLSTLVQRIWFSVKNFYLQVTVLMTIFVPTAVSWQHFNVHSFSRRRRESNNRNFYLLLISEMFLARTLLFKSFKIHVALCSFCKPVINICGKIIIFMNRMFNIYHILTEKKPFRLHESRIPDRFSGINLW